MTKPPQLKKLDPSIKIYYVFKLSNILYVVYDQQMIMPIQYGSLTVTEATVRSIKQKIQGAYVYYLDYDTELGFKYSDVKSRTHNPPS